MEKIDFRKVYGPLYNPPKDRFVFVDVPILNFLKVDGHGDPNTDPSYVEALGALYAVAYGIKFALKPTGLEYSVPPLQGLWWVPNMEDFATSKKSDWDWTMMILQPEQVTLELVEKVKQEAARKKVLPALSKLRLEAYAEGLAAQVLYFGAYADEGPTIARLHAWIAEQGYGLTGLHHEIYLGDPRKAAPEKLKTIIRQPVRKLAG
jgi:hypothetical protein